MTYLLFIYARNVGSPIRLTQLLAVFYVNVSEIVKKGVYGIFLTFWFKGAGADCLLKREVHAGTVLVPMSDRGVISAGPRSCLRCA